jgi:chromate reductase, NAD(P)H dehydrogenase (quinone)
MQIGTLTGSISQQSINRKLVDALIDVAPDHVEFHDIRIDGLPLYDYDLDDDYPSEAIELKRSIERSDGLLFATPEYNRSVPGALKNAIDWASRPYGDSAFTGIPAGIVSASVGAPGGAMAQQHLRNILGYLDVPTLGQPEAFIHFTPERFDDQGRLVDDSTRDFLSTWMTAFVDWVELVQRDRVAA